MTRYWILSLEDRKPFHFPDRDSSRKPLIDLSPAGPDIETISFHFSYRFSTSVGAEARLFDTRLCSYTTHISKIVYILNMICQYSRGSPDPRCITTLIIGAGCVAGFVKKMAVGHSQSQERSLLPCWSNFYLPYSSNHPKHIYGECSIQEFGREYLLLKPFFE